MSGFKISSQKLKIERGRLPCFLQKNEPLVFLSICILTLLPIFTSQYFVTVDGPSHLYNSKIWSSLIMDSNPFLSNFYSLNLLIPNMISHVLLSILSAFLPAFIAEKILITAYVLLFAYSFRYLLKSFGESNILFSYFIFPFIFSLPFLLGFYNFSFGIILLFFTIAYWIRHIQAQISWEFIFWLSILSFLTFLSHLVIIGLLFFILILECIATLLKTEKILPIKTAIPRLVSLIVASILPLFFLYGYFSHSPVSPELFETLPILTLVKNLLELSPIIAFNYAHELPFALLISFVLIGLTIITLVKILRTKNGTKYPSSNRKNVQLFAGLALASVLVLYFTLPNSDGNGSYVSVRLGLIVFPFLILYLSLHKHSRLIIRVGVSFVLLAHFVLVAQYALTNKQVNPIIKEIIHVSKLVEPNSIIAVAKETEIWYMPNYSNYLGMETPMVFLDNYEPNLGYFPVIWNQNSLPEVSILGQSVNVFPCIHYKPKAKGLEVSANYLLVIGNSENLAYSCHEAYSIIQSNNVQMLHYSSRCSLYKL